MTLKTVDFRLGMSDMANRTVDFAKVGLVRISVGEILRSRFGYQRLKGTMTPQTFCIFHCALTKNILVVTGCAGDVLCKMASIEMVRFDCGGEHLLQQDHINFGRRAVRLGGSRQTETLARLPGMAIQAIRLCRSFEMGKMEAGIKFVWLGQPPSLRGMAFHADAHNIALNRGVLLWQNRGEIFMTD